MTKESAKKNRTTPKLPPPSTTNGRSHDALAASSHPVTGYPANASSMGLSVLKQRPFDKSQNRIVASSPALTSTLLSDVTASDAPSRYGLSACAVPPRWGMSNNLIVWSRLR